MMNFKTNKGVTLTVLMVTIIVMLIIVGVTVTTSINSIDQTMGSQDLSEMLIVQQAIMQKYQESLEAKEGEISLPGTIVTYEGQRRYKIDDVTTPTKLKSDFQILGISGNVTSSVFYVDYETRICKKRRFYRRSIWI